MGAFAVPMMIASTVMQGFSILQQGKQASAMANYEAKQAEANAAAEPVISAELFPVEQLERVKVAVLICFGSRV